MKLTIELAKCHYQVAINSPLSVAIPMYFNQASQQPNHFGATAALSSPMQAGSFIGDTQRGGSCNVNELTINVHCNGTHTETIAHICDFAQTVKAEYKGKTSLAVTIDKLSLPALMPSVLISLSPELASTSHDSYSPAFEVNDVIISRNILEQALKHYNDGQLQVLAIRTLPNEASKCQQVYNNEHQPAFFSREAMVYLNERSVEHLVVDIPSVDRLLDDGLMTCHHLFWQVEEGSHQALSTCLSNKTITEMAYFDATIPDGFYAINIQTPAFNNDAAPSRPVLFALSKINELEDNHE